MAEVDTITVLDSSSATKEVPTLLSVESLIIAGIQSSTIANGYTSLTPKFVKIAASSSGTNAIVAAVASKKIRVLAYSVVASAAVNGKFQSDAAGTPVDLTGLKYLSGAGSGIVQSFNPVGWFESASGKSLDLNLSGAIAVGGELVYIEV